MLQGDRADRRLRSLLRLKRRLMKPSRLAEGCAGGVARHAHCKRVPGRRSRTIDRSNVDRLRTRTDVTSVAQDQSLRSVALRERPTVFHQPLLIAKALRVPGWKPQPPSSTPTSMPSMHRSSNCSTPLYVANPLPSAVVSSSRLHTKPRYLESAAACRGGGRASFVRN